MGAYSGKLLTMYISPTGVRVAEGENKDCNPSISRFFTVPAVEEFFAEVPGSAGVYEVTNMSGLISAILEECANQRTTAKKVLISTNCLGIETSVRAETGSGANSLKDKLFADVGGGGGKAASASRSHEKQALGTLQCKNSWGELIQDGVATRQTSTTVGDKFVLQSMTQEFFYRGYTVVGVSDCVGTLMNLRQVEEATFDHKGKIIFDFDTAFSSINLVKDLPVGINRFSAMDSFELRDRILALVQDAVEVVGRSPKIFITGSMMRDTQLYCELLDRLESLGFAVYDLFDRPTVDPDTGREPGTGRPVLTPDYAINIAMLMSAHVSNLVVLTPHVGMDVMFKQNNKALSGIVLGIACAIFAVAVAMAGSTTFEVLEMQGNPSRVSSLQSEISTLQSKQQQLQNTIATLTQADVTVLDTLNFVYSSVSPMINIISIDTVDMLASPEVETGGTVSEDFITGGTEGGEYGGKRQAIIIRGYARTAEAAIDYYKRLFNYGLPVDPVLKGVEKFVLPNGRDIVHIFEIEIGGM